MSRVPMMPTCGPTRSSSTTFVSKLREQASEATHYVVFDACRDELRLTRQGKKALGAEKGFTPVNTVTGVMIAYATAPGRTASAMRSTSLCGFLSGPTLPL